jgi:LPXTG-motif cell wall-anchored protein
MKRLVVFAILVIVLNAAPALASEEGHPPTSVANVTCEKVTIDPEPDWGVVEDGTIGGQSVHIALTPVAGTHESSADISMFTMVDGPIAYELTSIWTIAPNPYGVTSGAGTTVTGTLTCHGSPKTTTSSSTTSTSSTTEAPSTTIATATTVCVQPRGCCLQDCGILPRTGSSSQILGIVGLFALCFGAIGLAHSRRKIR